MDHNSLTSSHYLGNFDLRVGGVLGWFNNP